MNRDFKSKDHIKPASRTGPDRRWWLVLLALFFGATFFLLVVNRTLAVADRALTNVIDGSSSMMEQLGTFMTAGVVSALHSPDEQQRISVLKQLEETELGESVADCIYESVKLNLDHDNAEIREAASNVWERIKDLPQISTNVSIETVRGK